MTRPFAIAVAAILLLTVGAILIVRRVTEPAPPGPAAAGSAAAGAEAPPQVLVPPSQADLPASGPAAGTTPSGTNPYGATLNQPQAPAPVPAAQPAQPVDSEEGDQRRRPPGRVLNRGSRGDRPQQPNQSDE